MADDTTEATEGKKGGFFKKLLKIAFVAAIVATVAQILKRRRGQDLDDVEWQELPPPPAVSPTPRFVTSEGPRQARVFRRPG